ncbi:acyl-CoA thioesterase [Actinoplanes couchii]|uniref:Thioesterase n=1 Tax=Actinoplanes couchii TaxID=403638 RepID=A0ABQ3XLM7_9ACTN|nr:thioesterase family protein [Actinoplanes couchii]MDR6318254.1 acyl-CoA thioester hydrolase [Actinoplanes couchii]GID59375.1 thioesterase [Actinoplanes couchii]
MSFTYDSPVFFDELDPNGHLHNARFAVHVERAQTALFEQLTGGAAAPAARVADLHYVVRELHVEFLAPVSEPGPMPVTLTGLKIGTTSATYGFSCGTDPVRATGHRVIVKVDPSTGRPAPWSDWYRTVFQELTA